MASAGQGLSYKSYAAPGITFLMINEEAGWMVRVVCSRVSSGWRHGWASHPRRLSPGSGLQCRQGIGSKPKEAFCAPWALSCSHSSQEVDWGGIGGLSTSRKSTSKRPGEKPELSEKPLASNLPLGHSPARNRATLD